MKEVIKYLVVLSFFLLIISGCAYPPGPYPPHGEYPKPPDSNNIIKVANWNLQIFGVKKSEDENLMNIYVDKIDDYDIVFVQEIRDASGTAFPKLCSLLPEYDCMVSSRAGRSASKEQYGVIYKKGISILDFVDYNPDSQDRWERPPVMVSFNIGGYVLKAYNIHTKPEDVPNELTALQGIVEDEGNVIILGDLNADCSYYDNEEETQFDSWFWLVKDEDDTTVSGTDCAYDRIILNSDAQGEFISYGISKDMVEEGVSDHYLVWAELNAVK